MASTAGKKTLPTHTLECFEVEVKAVNYQLAAEGEFITITQTIFGGISVSLSLKENMMLVLQHKEPEYMPLISDFDQAWPGGMDFVCEAPRVSGVNKDWFGQSWTFEPKIGACNPTPGCYLLDDITKWKDVIRFPSFDKMDWEGYAARDTAGWDRDRKMSRVTIGYGMWERLFCIMPFDEALCALIEEPEACYEFFGAVADHKIRLHEYVIKYYKPDVLCMHDDYGSGTGMFMSPEVWRELIKPHLQRVIDHVRDHGVMYEHHCCGYFAPILPEMADMGVTMFNSVHKSNKPAELKKQIGHKITFNGGFDTQYMDGENITEEEIRAHVRNTIDELAPGGSWVPRYMLVHRDRGAFITDELLKYGATHYYGKRPGNIYG